MNDVRERIEEMLNDLKQERDELKVNLQQGFRVISFLPRFITR